MNFAERFEDLEIWKESRRLNKMTYSSLEECRDFSFRDQMRRTFKDFAHFLDLAKGSAGEVRSMTYAAEDLRILDSVQAKSLRNDYETLSKRISAFQKHLRRE